MGSIYGTEQNDTIHVSSSDSDYVYGLGGADTFYWSPGGRDTINGGSTGESYDTNVYGNRSGGDTLFFNSMFPVNVTMTSTENGTATVSSPYTTNDVLTFIGIERIHLTNGNDVLDASKAVLNAPHGGTPAHGLSIYAGGGNDSIIGSRYDDFIDGGAGNDTILAGGGNDFIQSSTGNDLINAGAGDDNIRWGQGNFEEVIGNDTVYGAAGHDLMNIWVKDGYNENGPGVEVKITATRADGAFSGTSFTDIGGARSTLQFHGIEQVWAHEGRDTIDGSGAKVTGTIGFHANGRWGDDVLIGSRGNDTLEGGAGRDTITGGSGDDLISTNGDYFSWNAPADGSVDTLIFNRGFGHDTVLAFEAIDVLDIRDGMTYVASERSNGTLLTFDTGDTILLANYFDFI